MTEHRPGVHLCWRCERPILYRDWVTLTAVQPWHWAQPDSISRIGQEWYHAGCLADDGGDKR